MHERWNFSGSISIAETIDKVCNEYESRMCATCEFCIEDSSLGSIWVECRKKGSPMNYVSLLTEKGYPNIIDFSCKYWEIK